jgi:hypothetical protein
MHHSAKASFPRINLNLVLPSIWKCISDLWDAILPNSSENPIPNNLTLSLSCFTWNLLAGVPSNQDQVLYAVGLKDTISEYRCNSLKPTNKCHLDLMCCHVLHGGILGASGARHPDAQKLIGQTQSSIGLLELVADGIWILPGIFPEIQVTIGWPAVFNQLVHTWPINIPYHHYNNDMHSDSIFVIHNGLHKMMGRKFSRCGMPFLRTMDL